MNVITRSSRLLQTLKINAGAARKPFPVIPRHYHGLVNNKRLSSQTDIDIAGSTEMRKMLQKSTPQCQLVISRNKKHKAKPKPGRRTAEAENPESKLTEDELTEELIEKLNEEMETELNQLKEDFATKLTLRSTTGALDNIMVNVPGQGPTPLDVVVQIFQKNPKTIILDIAESPELMDPITKALQKSHLRLNPIPEGTTLVVPIPKVTMEERERLAKEAQIMAHKNTGEKYQSICDHYRKVLHKQKGVSKDIIHELEEQIKEKLKKYKTDTEKLMKAKQKELLGK